MERASAWSPDMAQPMWRSISNIFSTPDVSRRVEVTRFSTPRMTPSPVATYPILSNSSEIWQVSLTPMAVDPSLIASKEYSTWKRRPSGEKVLKGGISGQRWRIVYYSTILLDTAICSKSKVTIKSSEGSLGSLPYSDLAMNILVWARW